MDDRDATYIGPVTAALALSEQSVPRSNGRWCAFAEARRKEARSSSKLRVWLGVVQAREADEVYLCRHTHRLRSAAEACAVREAKHRAREEECHSEAKWRERLCLDQPIAVERLSVSRSVEEARRLGYLVTSGPSWSSRLEVPWRRDCEQRDVSCVVVHLQRARYVRVGCDMLTAGVDNLSKEQRPLYWLTRSFTDVGGESWYGVISGSDRCPRGRAAELAIRLVALAREAIAGAYTVQTLG